MHLNTLKDDEIFVKLYNLSHKRIHEKIGLSWYVLSLLPDAIKLRRATRVQRVCWILLNIISGGFGSPRLWRAEMSNHQKGT